MTHYLPDSVQEFMRWGWAQIEPYYQALSLGGTADLPGLYSAAGAKFAFDPGTLEEAVDLVEAAMDELESKAQT